MAQTTEVPPATPALPPWQEAIEHAPAWMRWSAVALVAHTLFLLTPTGTATNDTVVEQVASAVRLVIEASALFWGAGRTDLPSRFRLALRISAWTSLVTALNYVLLVPQSLGAPALFSPTTDAWATLASYLGSLAALLVYPRTRPRSGETAALTLDTIITVGGVSLLSWTLVTQPTEAIAPDPGAQLWVRMFGLAQLAMLVGLNVVVVRGVALPSVRAFWWFVTGQMLYVPVVFLAQLREAQFIAVWPIDVVYFLGVLPTLVAAHLIRSDPLVPMTSSQPHWFLGLNPLPLVIPVLVGMALVGALVAEAYASALWLGVALAVISILLVVRLLLSARHTAVLVQDDAAREQRRQAERLQALGRLAGGIAHEFNNLMARVIGNTELGEASLPPGSPAAEHFVRARSAAMRAAALTQQLLAFSGQQRTRRLLIDADAVVHDCYLHVTAGLPAGIRPTLDRGPGPHAVVADAAQLRSAVEELVTNAVEAMPDGGRLGVRLYRDTLTRPLVTPWLVVSPGAYVVVSVADTGHGMTADCVAMACDPFYSTKPAHVGGGLGLASVHGFVAAHHGGIAIDSAPGEGTTVRLYLPAAAAPGGLL